jgi:hypothetical protein
MSVDPISASVVVGLLAQYAKHLAGVSSSAVDEQLKKGISALWTTVTRQLRREPTSAATLDRMMAEPDNPRRRAAVEDHLEEALRDDPAFRSDVANALRAVPSAHVTAHVENSGAVVTGGTLSISGHLAAGRDVVVPRTDPGPQS